MQLLETNVGLEGKGKISRLDHANFMPNFAQMGDQPDIIMQNLEGCSNFLVLGNGAKMKYMREIFNEEL
jgi:hypothetical protein